MDNYKRVVKHLNKGDKTELKSEKIMLSLIDDLRKVNSDASQIYKEAIKIADDYELILKQAKKAKQEAESAFRKLKPMKSKVFQEIKQMSQVSGIGNLVGELRKNPIYQDAIANEAGLDLIIKKLRDI
jgi:thiamine monophosphate kinase